MHWRSRLAIVTNAAQNHEEAYVDLEGIRRTTLRRDSTGKQAGNLPDRARREKARAYDDPNTLRLSLMNAPFASDGPFSWTSANVNRSRQPAVHQESPDLDAQAYEAPVVGEPQQQQQ